MRITIHYARHEEGVNESVEVDLRTSDNESMSEAVASAVAAAAGLLGPGWEDDTPVGATADALDGPPVEEPPADIHPWDAAPTHFDPTPQAGA